MMRKWGALEAFRHLGAEARDKFAWSAQSKDQSITVLTLWDDQIDDDGTTVTANVFARPGRENWLGEPRNQRRIRHLKDVWNGDRTFRVVMLKARDPDAVPRSTRERWPDDNLTMTLTEFDPMTGEFRAKGERMAGPILASTPDRPSHKYDPLAAFLRSYEGDEVRLTLDQIRSLVGKLPQDATTRQFWANAQSHHRSRRGQWLDAGFLAFYEPTADTVRFVRSGSGETKSGEGWTDHELRACVNAYRTLWLAQQKGSSVNKSKLRRSVLEISLPTRSPTAYEKRMQNISAMVADLGIQPVQGYVPLHNVGAVKARLIRMINEAWERQDQLEKVTADPGQLETRVEAALQKIGKTLGPPPPGSKDVKRKPSTSGRFVRDPNVIAWVLRVAGGTCEVCKSPAPFQRADGTPYLEVHHVRPLSQGGPDTTDNAVAGCPNCHRRLHEGDDREELRKQIIKDLPRLINHPKLELSPVSEEL